MRMSPMQSSGPVFSLRRTFAIGMAAILAVAAVITIFMSFEMNDADEILVVQSPFWGDLTWHTSAGVKWQGFGKVSTYKKRSIYRFDTEKYEDVKGADGKVVKKLVCCGLDVRFNEGGHGTMLGSIQYDMPLDPKNLTAIHTRFGSAEAVQRQVIETSTNKAIYHSGPLMSSKESYAEKRNDLIHVVEDQIQYGVYKTRQKEVRAKDPLSGQEKSVTVVEIVRGPDGKEERQEISVLSEFGMRAFNFTIKKLPYDEVVEAQIQQQQVIAMDVQTAIAESKKAEQRAITVEQQGRANAADAKWKQEVVKAQVVTQAQQQLEVARLDAQAAEQTKRKLILEGEGEGEKRRLIMTADGALEPKLKALVEINKAYADAIKGYQGNWVPGVVMGGGASAVPGSGAQILVDLLTANTARQLGVDLGVSGVQKTVADKPTASPAPVPPGRK